GRQPLGARRARAGAGLVGSWHGDLRGPARARRPAPLDRRARLRPGAAGRWRDRAGHRAARARGRTARAVSRRSVGPRRSSLRAGSGARVRRSVITTAVALLALISVRAQHLTRRSPTPLSRRV